MTKEELKGRLRTSYSSVVHLIQKFDEESYKQAPSPDKWSAAEIVEHLIISTNSISRGLNSSKEKLTQIFGQLEREEYDSETLYALYKKALAGGLKAPSAFSPQEVAQSKKEHGEQFMASLDALIKALAPWDERDLSKQGLPHPAIGLMSLRELLDFTDFHTKHHSKQIEAIVLSTSAT